MVMSSSRSIHFEHFLEEGDLAAMPAATVVVGRALCLVYVLPALSSLLVSHYLDDSGAAYLVVTVDEVRLLFIFFVATVFNNDY